MDDEDLMPDLPEKIREWIEKKTKAYHARKTSGKTAAQYRAGLEYTASERLEICLNEGCDEQQAQYIVVRALGKGAAVFHALLSEHHNTLLATIEAERKAERDVAEAKLHSQQAAIETMKEDRDITRDLVRRVSEMVTQVNGTMLALADKLPTLALTHEAKPANPEAASPEDSNPANSEDSNPANSEDSNPANSEDSNPASPEDSNPEAEIVENLASTRNEEIQEAHASRIE